MKIKLEDGTRYKPKADDSVVCEDHNVTVRWGDLDAIQQLPERHTVVSRANSAPV